MSSALTVNRTASGRPSDGGGSATDDATDIADVLAPACAGVAHRASPALTHCIAIAYTVPTRQPRPPSAVNPRPVSVSTAPDNQSVAAGKTSATIAGGACANDPTASPPETASPTTTSNGATPSVALCGVSHDASADE